MSKTLGQRLADLNIEVGTAMMIDWQQVRIQAAIVQGWASTPQGLTKVCMAGAVELADALIAELQKKGGEQ